MAEPIKDAADATNRVMEFMRKHYSFGVPVRADLEGSWWIVDVDVGVVKRIIVRVRVQPSSGEIEDYFTLSEMTP